jgi:hypothetical protein
MQASAGTAVQTTSKAKAIAARVFSTPRCYRVERVRVKVLSVSSDECCNSFGDVFLWNVVDIFEWASRNLASSLTSYV